MRLTVLKAACTALAAYAMIAFGLAGVAHAQVQGQRVQVDAIGTYYDPSCNCNKNQDGATIVMMNATTMCVANCMTDGEWADCATKSWYGSSKDQRYTTPRFREQCGMVCAPINSPRMSYLTHGTKRHIVFRFGPRS